MLRLRPSVVLLEAVPGALLIGLVVVAAGRFTIVGWAIGTVVAVFLATIRAVRIRRRTLTVTADGLDVQRDRYAMHVPWDSITRTQKRRLQGLVAIEELVSARSTISPRSSSGRSRPFPKALQSNPEHPATTRIQVSLYDKNWRTGEIGDQLRERGVAI